jgi:hypothetical protein
VGCLPICGTVSQISPPIRIVLVAAIALIGAWMLFLRPKTETTPPVPQAPPTAPGVKGLTNDIAKAKAASKTSDAANAKIQSATGGNTASGTAPATQAAGKSAAATPAAPKVDTAGLPKRVAKAIDDKKVVVLFFYNPKSADDRAVKKAVAKVDRWQGEVVVQGANVKSVSRYAKIARGADVSQSPTIVVVDRNLKAERLVGFQDTRSIDQAVVDALRNSGVLINSAYLRKINDVCRTKGASIWSVPSPEQLGSDVKHAVNVYVQGSAAMLADFKSIKAPARFAAFKRANVADLKTLHASNLRFQKTIGNGKSPANIVRAAVTQERELRGTAGGWQHRMDKHHVLSCGTNF